MGLPTRRASRVPAPAPVRNRVRTECKTTCRDGLEKTLLCAQAGRCSRPSPAEARKVQPRLHRAEPFRGVVGVTDGPPATHVTRRRRKRSACGSLSPGNFQVSWHFPCRSGFPAATIEAERLPHQKLAGRHRDAGRHAPLKVWA